MINIYNDNFILFYALYVIGFTLYKEISTYKHIRNFKMSICSFIFSLYVLTIYSSVTPLITILYKLFFENNVSLNILLKFSFIFCLVIIWYYFVIFIEDISVNIYNRLVRIKNIYYITPPGYIRTYLIRRVIRGEAP